MKSLNKPSLGCKQGEDVTVKEEVALYSRNLQACVIDLLVGNIYYDEKAMSKQELLEPEEVLKEADYLAGGMCRLIREREEVVAFEKGLPDD